MLVLTARLAVAPSATAPAFAEVVHGSGYSATVLGWTSWYGNYGLGGLGWGWCIDHGIAAPDAALGYQPTFVADASADTRAAMAWATSSNVFTDRVGAAATMLVLHDLMGAQYPFGRINVDGLSVEHLAGFGGDEGAVIGRARQIKADALAHAGLRGPASLRLEVTPVAPGARGTVRAIVGDANGLALNDMVVELSASGATLDAGVVRTGPDGTVTVGFVAGNGDNAFQAVAQILDPELQAYGPTAAPAQRIARPGFARVPASVAFVATPPTTAPPTTGPVTTTTSRRTTTTTAPSTTTTRPPTTTTAPSTTTTRPPTTLPPTTTSRPPTTTAPSTTTTQRPTTTTAPSTTSTTTRRSTTTAPATTTPPTTAPGTSIPATSIPGTSIPGTSIPGTSVPGSTMPPTTTAPPRAAVPPMTVPTGPSGPSSPGIPSTPSTSRLPYTGSATRPLLQLGGGSLLLGAALVLLARERRRTLRAGPGDPATIRP